jgi:hypothetical protein
MENHQYSMDAEVTHANSFIHFGSVPQISSMPCVTISQDNLQD